MPITNNNSNKNFPVIDYPDYVGKKTIAQQVASQSKEAEPFISGVARSLKRMVKPDAREQSAYKGYKIKKELLTFPHSLKINENLGNEFNKEVIHLLSGKNDVEVGSPLYKEYLDLIQKYDKKIQEENSKIVKGTNEKYNNLDKETLEGLQENAEVEHAQWKYRAALFMICPLVPINIFPQMVDLMGPLFEAGDFARFVSQFLSTDGPLGDLAFLTDAIKLDDAVDWLVREGPGKPVQEIVNVLMDNGVAKELGEFAGGDLSGVFVSAVMGTYLSANKADLSSEKSKIKEGAEKSAARIKDNALDLIQEKNKEAVENFAPKLLKIKAEQQNIIEIDKWLRSKEGKKFIENGLLKDDESGLQEKLSEDTYESRKAIADLINSELMNKIYKARGTSRGDQSRKQQEYDFKKIAVHGSLGEEMPVSQRANELLSNNPDYFYNLSRNQLSGRDLSPLKIASIMVQMGARNDYFLEDDYVGEIKKMTPDETRRMLDDITRQERHDLKLSEDLAHYKLREKYVMARSDITPLYPYPKNKEEEVESSEKKAHYGSSSEKEGHYGSGEQKSGRDEQKSGRDEQKNGWANQVYQQRQQQQPVGIGGSL